MDTPAGITLQIRRGFAFFEFPLDPAQRLGKHFDDYPLLVRGDDLTTVSAQHCLGADNHVVREQHDQVVRFECGLIVKRDANGQRAAVLTESQKTMVDWILVQHHSALIESVSETVVACYTDKKPVRWRDYLGPIPSYVSERDLFFLEGVPPAPTIPTEYTIEDFIRITDMFLNQHGLIFGVLVSVAWSEAQIGLRYKAHGGAAPDLSVPFWCTSVGPDDTAFC